ncbi:hypothetical protein [Nocardia fluminea]|uniref:hypothetical protein n=1 Tax=Nocardia fluminea TaxID=134984 RepID=UPI003D116A6B
MATGNCALQAVIEVHTTTDYAPWTNPVPGLPSAVLLEHACRGLPLVSAGEPILDAALELASELAELHRERLMRLDVDGVDRRRRMCVGAIDALAVAALPPPPEAARENPESIGAIVDRLASWCVLAGDACPIRLSATAVAAAGEHVDELCRGYTVLLDELADRSCRLPTTTTLPRPTLTSGRDLTLRRCL